MMNKIGNMLRSYGVTKGDSVALYLPASPMAAACMLACARIGALHSVVFAGFSAESLASRINDGL
jgi:acetyl-CoA synthetase